MTQQENDFLTKAPGDTGVDFAKAR